PPAYSAEFFGAKLQPVAEAAFGAAVPQRVLLQRHFPQLLLREAANELLPQLTQVVRHRLGIFGKPVIQLTFPVSGVTHRSTPLLRKTCLSCSTTCPLPCPEPRFTRMSTVATATVFPLTPSRANSRLVALGMSA